MQTSIEIYEASKDDVHEIAVMTSELLREIMYKIGKDVFSFNQEETKERAKELLSKDTCSVFVAKHKEKIVGFICVYECYALYAEGSFGTISELYVRPEYRSLDVGKGLLKKVRMLSVSKNFSRLEVTTPPLPQFEKSLSFYQKNGFEISGGRKLKMDIS